MRMRSSSNEYSKEVYFTIVPSPCSCVHTLCSQGLKQSIGGPAGKLAEFYPCCSLCNLWFYVSVRRSAPYGLTVMKILERQWNEP
jgi:hypothetical protein